MQEFIESIYNKKYVRDASGTEYPLNSSIDRNEGAFIYDLIDSAKHIRKTLEIGCAYGLSSLYICWALSGRQEAAHTIVDPFQHRSWHGVGIANLERMGCDFYTLIEEPSEFVLPRLAQNEPETYDAIIIDGWHTFDHTLLDLFYANKLIKEGGYIIIDDCNFSSVAKAVSYFAKYPAYEIHGQAKPDISLKRFCAGIINKVIPEPVAAHVLPHHIYDTYYIRTVYSSMVALRKIGPDERNWDWYVTF